MSHEANGGLGNIKPDDNLRSRVDETKPMGVWVKSRGGQRSGSLLPSPAFYPDTRTNRRALGYFAVGFIPSRGSLAVISFGEVAHFHFGFVPNAWNDLIRGRASCHK